MPIFTFECEICGVAMEELCDADAVITCPSCNATMNKLMGAPSFRMTGLRAANGYGLKSIDTYGQCQVTGIESGYSYTDKRGTKDYNARNGKQK